MKANKNELLNMAVREFGFEDTCTIELFRMAELDCKYEEMKNYYELYKAAAAEDFFGFND